MLRLRLSASESRSVPIGRRLVSIDGVSRVLSSRSPGEAIVVLSADVEPGAADDLLAILAEFGVQDDSYLLERLDVVAPITAKRIRLGGPTFAWLEVLGEARANSRPLARYLVMMAVAGVIAALGVLKSNPILIVGAMAVSPDLLPVCSVCVGIVGRRRKLVNRSLATLVIGLGLTASTAALLTFLLSISGILASGFAVDDSALKPLAAEVDYSTILVALAAGVAAMISFETRASAAVGVAISVTTIPASAYLGVALGNGEAHSGLGALAVLAINVALLIVSGTLTLLAQRFAATRSARPA